MYAGGGRVNFYGTITSEGTGCFRIYNGNTNSNVYCDIIDNYLISTVQLYQMKKKLSVPVRQCSIPCIETNSNEIARIRC